jgi:prophage regulatory protein
MIKPLLLSYEDLRDLGIRYSKAHLWRLWAADKFPKPIKLTPTSRNVWSADEVDTWIKQRIAERDQAAA